MNLVTCTNINLVSCMDMNLDNNWHKHELRQQLAQIST